MHCHARVGVAAGAVEIQVDLLALGERRQKVRDLLRRAILSPALGGYNVTVKGHCGRAVCLVFHVQVLASDLLVLATPIYSWYCTPPMKALLDRLVYGMNKFYGREKGPSLWQGKAMALLMTCGYRPEKGCDLFEEGMRRYCKHSGLRYLGSHAERHLGYDTAFMDADKEARTRAFARELMGAV